MFERSGFMTMDLLCKHFQGLSFKAWRGPRILRGILSIGSGLPFGEWGGGSIIVVSMYCPFPI